jgi:hypothetical protein
MKETVPLICQFNSICRKAKSKRRMTKEFSMEDDEGEESAEQEKEAEDENQDDDVA